MGIGLRVYRKDNSFLTYLPEFASLKVQEDHNNLGSVEITYPRGGRGLDLVLAEDDAKVSIVVDGVEDPDAYLIEDDEEDQADAAAKARTVTITGRGMIALFDRAVVYPQAHSPGASLAGMNPVHRFTNASPGAILGTLLQRAQARGALTAIGYGSFNTAHDSSGRAWPLNYTVDFEAGKDYLTVLRGMVEAGWIDFRLVGLQLQVYVPDTTLGVDRPEAVLRLGRDVTQGPRKRTRRPIKSHVLLVGEEGAVVERANATTASVYGRREGFDGQSGITALDTLSAVGDNDLAQWKDAKEGFTLTYKVEDDRREQPAQPPVDARRAPVPGRDFNAGDYIRYDQRRLSATALEPLRVRTITRTYDLDGARSVEVDLADVFVEAQVRLARQVNAILNGSSSNVRAPLPPASKDSSVPNAPGAVGVATASFMDALGNGVGTATISWSSVTQNSDGTVFDDFGSYEVSYWSRITGFWGPSQAATQSPTYVGGLHPGDQFQARVAARDFSGNQSPWTYSPIVLVEPDATAPNAPSTPVVTSMIGGIKYGWDGLDVFAAPLSLDFDHLDVYASTTSAFTPGPSTFIDQLRGPGVGIIPNVPYGTTYYVVFIAVDKTGNRSTPSAQAGASPAAIGVENLAAEITNAIAAAAVDAANATTLANTAQVTANGKGRVYYQNTPPAGAGLSTADLWFDTAHDNRPNTWSGSAWVAFGLGDLAIGNLDAGKITTGYLGAARIQAGSITAEKLTIATLGDNQIPNGTFEEPSTADPTLPSRFVRNILIGSGASSAAYGGVALGGSRSVVLTVTGAAGASADLFSEPIPVAPGDVWYCSVLAKDSSGTSPGFYLQMIGGPAADNLPTFVSAAGSITNNVTVPTTPTKVEGAFTIPAGIYFVRLGLINNASQSTGFHTVTTDALTMQRAVVTARIADGAITAAKVQTTEFNAMVARINTAIITSAMIGSVSATSITAGLLNADIVLGARIKTASTGLRAEMNSGGFYHYNAANIEDFAADSLGVRIVGQLQTAPSGARVVLSQDPVLPIAMYTGANGEAYPAAILAESSGTGPGRYGLVWLFPPNFHTTAAAQLLLSSRPVSGTENSVARLSADSVQVNGAHGVSMSIGDGNLFIFGDELRGKGPQYNGNHLMRATEENKRLAQGGSFQTALGAGTNVSTSGTFDFTAAGQTNFALAAPIVVMTCVGPIAPAFASLRGVPNGAGFAWRVTIPGTTTQSSIVTVHYMAFGE